MTVSEDVLTIAGELMGARVSTDPRLEKELVVCVTVSNQRVGPVVGSILLIALDRTGEARARYLSWIGYADLDEACAAEAGRWELIEPAAPYRGQVVWQPFGWGTLEQVWTHPPPSERLSSAGNGSGPLTNQDRDFSYDHRTWRPDVER